MYHFKRAGSRDGGWKLNASMQYFALLVSPTETIRQEGLQLDCYILPTVSDGKDMSFFCLHWTDIPFLYPHRIDYSIYILSPPVIGTIHPQQTDTSTTNRYSSPHRPPPLRADKTLLRTPGSNPRPPTRLLRNSLRTVLLPWSS